ncbi:MAG: sensor histidine kinase [Acidimicrobiia bacterium]
MRRRIFWGGVLVAVVVLALAATAGAVIRQQLVRRSHDELTRQAEVAARLVQRTDLASFILGTDTGRQTRTDQRPARQETAALVIGRLLEVVKEVGGHDYLEAARVTPSGLAVLVEDPEVLGQVPAGLENGNGLEIEVDGHPVIASVRTVPIGEGAHLRIAFARDEPLLDTALFTRPLLFALIVGAVLALLLAFAVSRRLGKKLDPIEDAARAIADGDFGARVPVTERDELGRVAAAFNEMAGQLQGARERERDFLMSVGHDLRTPLTTIRGYAEALDGGDVEGDDLPRVAGVLHRQTDRLSRLVEDLMLLARLQAREFTLRPERVDVAAHLKEVVDGYRTRADEVRLRLDARLDPVGVGLIDPDRIGQMLGNLIDNAFRYTPEGGTVTIALARTVPGFEITVTDTGPGIDPEDVPRVFERLYVAQRYRPVRPEGSGLGLSIVKELSEAMGGVVSVASTPGQGTSVTVRLPLETGSSGTG